MQTPITPRRALVEAPRYEVGLTDGWYGFKAQLDPHLEALIDRGRIIVGTKLRVVGAEVEYCHRVRDARLLMLTTFAGFASSFARR